MRGREDVSVAICAAVRDIPENVLEWVRYHSFIGICKFYLMVTDDPEVANMETVLQSEIDIGLVELYSLPYVNPRTVSQLQVRLYGLCLESVRADHDFVGFWDVDEFLIPMNGTDSKISTVLKQYVDVGGLAVNWRIVGPSYHMLKPPGGVLENYNMCTPWSYEENEEIKTIVNTKFAIQPTTDPHTFVYKNGYGAVDDAGRPVPGVRNPRKVGDVQAFALYHYVTKSKEEYEDKMRRGSAMGNRKKESYFDMISKIATSPCLEGQAMFQQMKGYQARASCSRTRF